MTLAEIKNLSKCERVRVIDSKSKYFNDVLHVHTHVEVFNEDTVLVDHPSADYHVIEFSLEDVEPVI